MDIPGLPRQNHLVRNVARSLALLVTMIYSSSSLFRFASSVVAAIALGSGLCTAVNAQTFANGSLTGPPASNLPAGWTPVHGVTATTNLSSYAFSGPGSALATPSESPDGGSWAMLWVEDSHILTYTDFGQSVSGFSPGSEYTVSWYHANFGYAPPAGYGAAYNNGSAISLWIDNAFAGSGGSRSPVSGWVAESVTFVAQAETLFLSFRSGSASRAVVSIDGISISPVPEPASAWLMLSGGLGLGVLARRRRASGARA